MSRNLEPCLDDELQAIEERLTQLAPATVSTALSQRMDLITITGSVNVTETLFDSDHLDSEDDAYDLSDLELYLSDLSPATMTNGMLDRMSEAMERWHDSGAEEKIVPLSSGLDQKKIIKRHFGGGMLSAAAAVAVMGAVAALVLPGITSTTPPATTAKSESQAVERSLTPRPLITPRHFSSGGTQNVSTNPQAWAASDTLSHNVTSTRDTGVIYSEGHVPHRCIRIDYVDKIKVLDKNGSEIEIRTPGVDYMLIPVETN